MWYPNLPWDIFLISTKTYEFAQHQIFAKPEFQSKRKRRATLLGAGYTKYQPEMIFADIVRAKNLFLRRTSSKAPEHQSVA